MNFGVPCVLALVASASAWPEPSFLPTCDAPPGLAFSITAEPNVVTKRQKILLRWELKNAGKAPVSVCRWPGPIFRPSWDYAPDGTLFLDVREDAFTSAPVRDDFVEVKPGDALTGSGQIEAFPTPTRKLMIRGEFRSGSSGERYGVKAWQGRVCSPWITINVPEGNSYVGKRAQ
jgi:hypothetical protein